MRTKIKVGKKYYKPVPWLGLERECLGCAFDSDGCINTLRGFICDDGNEFAGMILIPHNKEALAEYIAKRLVPDAEAE